MMNRRVVIALSGVAVAAAAALLFSLKRPDRGLDSDNLHGVANGAARWSSKYYAGEARSPQRAAPMALSDDEAPVLSAPKRRAGEAKVNFEGRVAALRDYQNWLDAASPSAATERQVRRILADAQLNLGLYMQAMREATGIAAEDGEMVSLGKTAREFDAEVKARLAQVLDERELELFERFVGHSKGFCAFAPFGIPTPGLPAMGSVSADAG